MHSFASQPATTGISTTRTMLGAARPIPDWIDALEGSWFPWKPSWK
jgi:hypothetical protein